MARFVAVIFTKFDPTTGRFIPSSEKPYFYYDPWYLELGQYGLVHTGRDFGVVQIVRHLIKREAMEKANKPIIAPINPEPSIYINTINELADLAKEVSQANINRAIDEEIRKSNPRSKRPLADPSNPEEPKEIPF